MIYLGLLGGGLGFISPSKIQSSDLRVKSVEGKDKKGHRDGAKIYTSRKVCIKDRKGIGMHTKQGNKTTVEQRNGKGAFGRGNI